MSIDYTTYAHELAKEISDILDKLQKPLKSGNPEGLQEDIVNRSQWLARSVEILADAKEIRDRALGELAEKHPDLSVQKIKLIGAFKGASEEKLFVLSERMNATITHQLDSARSLLSYEKESMRL